MKKSLFLFLILITSLNVYSQRDREFWFACPDLSSSHSDTEIYLNFVTFDKPAVVTISQPANPSFTPIISYIPPNEYFDEKLNKSLVEILPGAPRNFGLLITSDEDIVCFYANKSDNTEVYTLKGRNALGTDFIVPMQYEMDNSVNHYNGISSIEIVASEDGTVVEITPTAGTTAPQTNGKITVNLNRGQAYAVRAKSALAKDHLHNTRIKSNKPIAVSYTDDSLPVGAEDLLGDQLVPISMAGTDYIAVKNDGPFEKVYIFPTEDNTEVEIDGVNIPNLLSVSAKDKYVYTLTNQATYISANSPIIVLQVSSELNHNSLGEPGGAVLPHIRCTGSQEVVYQSAFREPCILNIVTKTAYTGGFSVVINGVSSTLFASNFKEVPNTGGEWSYYRYRAKGNDVVRIKNSLGSFHLGAYDKKGDSCSYGYFSDYQPIELQPQLSQNYYVAGDRIHLYLIDSSSYENVIWTRSDGMTFYGNELIIENATEEDSGVYEVTATSKDNCNVKPSYVDVNVFKANKYQKDVCYGEEITLAIEGSSGPYSWKPYLGFPNSPEITVSPLANTIYTVSNYKKGENILIYGDFQTLAANANIDSDYLNGGTTPSAVATPGKYSVYNNAASVNPAYEKVNDHTFPRLPNIGRHMIVNTRGQANDKIFYDTIKVKENTYYLLSGWFITPQLNGPQAQLNFAINGTVSGDLITPPLPPAAGVTSEDWKQFSSKLWHSGTNNKAIISITTNALNPQGAGVCIDDLTFTPLFQLTDTFDVRVFSELQPKITGDSVICDGNTTIDAGEMNEGMPFTSYKWYLLPNKTNPIGTERVLSVDKGGTYVVEVNFNTCVGTDTVTLPPVGDLDITIDTNIDICNDEPNYIINYKIKDNELDFYNVIYDQAAKNAGFTDLENQQLTDDGEVVIPLPAGVIPGTYQADIKFVANTICKDNKTFKLNIVVKIASGNLMQQKWDDMLALYNQEHNGGTQYVAYQWYKNGTPIPGETKSYLYIGAQNSFSENDSYSILLTSDDGLEVLTCDFIPEQRSSSNPFPTLVTSNEEISVAINELLKYETGGTVNFFDISGIRYSSQKIDINNQKIRTPKRSGVYILNIITTTGQKNFKVLVK